MKINKTNITVFIAVITSVMITLCDLKLSGWKLEIDAWALLFLLWPNLPPLCLALFAIKKDNLWLRIAATTNATLSILFYAAPAFFPNSSTGALILLTGPIICFVVVVAFIATNSEHKHANDK